MFMAVFGIVWSKSPTTSLLTAVVLLMWLLTKHFDQRNSELGDLIDDYIISVVCISWITHKAKLDHGSWLTAQACGGHRS